MTLPVGNPALSHPSQRNASILLLATISADRFLLVFNPVWCQNYRGPVWPGAGLHRGLGLALLLTIPSFVFRQVYVEHYRPRRVCRRIR